MQGHAPFGGLIADGARIQAINSWEVVQWRATADEDGHYCFAVMGVG
jgi:hypothetical protein